jgi:uncharacterized membrane protein
MNVVQESIVVNAAVADVYARWMRFEDLPQFIKPMRNVQRIDDTHFSFTAGRDGHAHEGTVEVMFRNPERRIAWRMISTNVELGVVSFEPQMDGATEVTLKLRSAFNPLLSSESARQYLADFKSLVEASPGNQRG